MLLQLQSGGLNFMGYCKEEGCVFPSSFILVRAVG